METENGQARSFCYHCILLVILAVAACARFYALDASGLSAEELLAVSTCRAPGWLEMAGQFISATGMPPLYPTLLCNLLSWTGDADFFVRGLSACAGLLSVYFMYALGRHLFSPVAGLLVAAVLATDFQTVVIHREATLYALLSATFAMHAYCFCRVFFPAGKDAGAPLVLAFSSRHAQGEWRWQLPLAVDVRFLPWFLLSGLLLAHSSSIALLPLLLELVASLLLVSAVERKTVFRSVWFPLLVMVLPWLHALSVYTEWVMKGNLFAWQPVQILWEKLAHFPLPDSPLRSFQLAVITLGLVALPVWCLLSGRRPLHRRQIALLVCQMALALLLMAVIPSAAPSSLLFFWHLGLLLAMGPVVALLLRYLPLAAQRGLVVLLVICVTVAQVRTNALLQLYSRGTKSGFLTAVQIVGNDESFMAGSRQVLANTTLFDHYLSRSGILPRGATVPGNGDAASLLQKKLATTDFYYLEWAVPQDADAQRDYPFYNQLTAAYGRACATHVAGFRVTRFSAAVTAGNTDAPDCRRKSRS